MATVAPQPTVNTPLLPPTADVEKQVDTQNAEDVMDEISRFPQMWKFCFYGFFKNLKFFEAFLLYILLGWGFNLLQLGILKSIEQTAEYLLEIPAGMFADRFGNKTLLLMCFVFYILSFLCYAMGAHWNTLVLAALFYGVGAAFRSGAHKAMILIWLEDHGYEEHAQFVYGRTRSYSMLGSALSSILGLVILRVCPDPSYLFYIATIPYVLDFILIMSYPSNLNAASAKQKKKLQKSGGFFASIRHQCVGLCVAMSERNTAKILLSTALFNAIHTTLKDFIQPIMMANVATIALSVGHPLPTDDEERADQITQAFLAGCYCLFYLLSSFSSKKAYLFGNLWTNKFTAADVVFDIFCVSLWLIGLCLYLNLPILVVFLFMLTYIMHSGRKPLMLAAIGAVMNKSQRTSILSVEALLKTTMVFVLAPSFGFVAHHYSLTTLFVIMPVVLWLIHRLGLSGASTAKEDYEKLTQ